MNALVPDHTARAHSTVVGGSSAGRVLQCPGSVQLSNRKTPEMPAAELRDWLAYNPETGVLRWKKVNNWRLQVGAVVGCVNSDGYVKFKIHRVSYSASRAIWALVYGYWPQALVDHEDNNRSNNRLSNLRLSTNQQNARNGKVRRQGLKGATWNKLESCWMSQIRWNGKNTHLGKFSTEAEAHEAYCDAALKFYGDFARFA